MTFIGCSKKGVQSTDSSMGVAPQGKVSDSPTVQGGGGTTSSLSGVPRATQVALLQNGSLKITGDYLDQVTGVSLKRDDHTYLLKIDSKDSSSLLASAKDVAIQFLSGTYELFLASAAAGDPVGISLSVDLSKMTAPIAVGTTQWVVKEGGYVGVGTSDPKVPFHLFSTTVPKGGPIESRFGMVVESEGPDTMGHRYGSVVYSDEQPPGFVGVRAKGTKVAPAAVSAGDSLLILAASGYAASATNAKGTVVPSGFSTVSRATIRLRASEDWTQIANGTNIVFSTTQKGSTSLKERVIIADTGNLGVGGGGDFDLTTGFPAATVDIQGILRLQANVAAPGSDSGHDCVKDRDGAIARTSKYTLCICKAPAAGTAAWVSVVDGSTSCVW